MVHVWFLAFCQSLRYYLFHNLLIGDFDAEALRSLQFQSIVDQSVNHRLPYGAAFGENLHACVFDQLFVDALRDPLGLVRGAGLTADIFCRNFSLTLSPASSAFKRT